MKKLKYLVFSILFSSNLLLPNNVFARNNNQCEINRFYGQDRYKTSISIANNFEEGYIDNVIIASGKNFPDALAGSVLSKKLNAPILLINDTVSGSRDAIKYVQDHLRRNGTIYMLGGKASISEEFVDKFKSMGFNDLVRLGGLDRFDTNTKIVEELKAEKGTPVIIVNGYNFPDALSISSVAAIKGYPILMCGKDKLPRSIKFKISDIKPSKVYVVGGEGVLKDSIINEIKEEVPELEDDNIERIWGSSRYDTSLNVVRHFNLDTGTIVMANGENFPDALSGSALAAKYNAPILLTNGKDVYNQKQYIDNEEYSRCILLGGSASISFSSQVILQGFNYNGNSSGNINNGGRVCDQGDWIYYSVSGEEDEGATYKIKKDGREKTKISDEYLYSMNIVEDWIYYIDSEQNLYKITTEGRRKTSVINDKVANFIIKGDWIYYINCTEGDVLGEKYLYKIRLDGSDKTRLTKEPVGIKFSSDDNYLYYMKVDKNKNLNFGNLCRINLDGSNNKKLNDEVLAWDLDVSNGWIYFNGYKMRIDGSNLTKFTDDYVVSTNVYGDWIYYTTISDDSNFEKDNFYKIKIDGSNKTKVINCGDVVNGMAGIGIGGNWVFYSDVYGIDYKVKLDGTEKEKLEIN